jgi:hypothetical protein
MALDIRGDAVRRSFRRMVGEEHRAQLHEHLTVWQGPPPGDLAKYPSLLLELCKQACADAVIVDWLKDAAVGLSADEVGAGYNRARQNACAAGVQVLELHHLRKALTRVEAEHPTIDGVYGSTWITSGAGSVVLLNGKPGDAIVSFHHIKQPASEVGPFKIIHDHDTGRSKIWHSVDLVLLAKQPGGLTAVAAAMAIFDTDKPPQTKRIRARRRLDKLTGHGFLKITQQGDAATNKPKIWAAKWPMRDPMRGLLDRIAVRTLRAVRATLNRPYAQT